MTGSSDGLLTDTLLILLNHRPSENVGSRNEGAHGMSLFESIKNAIFGHAAGGAPAEQAAAAGTAPPAPSIGATSQPSAVEPTRPAETTRSGAPAVNVEAVLERLSAQQTQKLNWRSSIVDLMKLVGLDPSQENRRALARELGYGGDSHDSAAMNVWLHQQVMQKLAASGGTVPDSLRR
jgi:hypothetical protein